MLEAKRARRAASSRSAERERPRDRQGGSAALVGLRTISRVLGVTGNQVYMWHQRRATTGFPEALAQVHIPAHPGDKRKAPLFDMDQVMDWWIGYDPNRNRGEHWKAKRDAHVRS